MLLFSINVIIISMENNELVKALSDSKKYKDLSYSTIENIAISNSYSEDKVRSKLHQIWGAYYSTRPDFNKLLKKLNEGSISLKDVLRIHNSTKERIDDYETIYKFINENIRSSSSILDIGCGLNPIFSILLKNNYEYIALDIDNSQQYFLNKLFEKYQLSKYTAIVGDALLDKHKPVDVVFALKLLPVLDQISREQTDLFLKNLECKTLIVSFPNKSLGGREKGMRENYRISYIDRIENLGYELLTLKEFNNETFYILKKIN